MNYLPWNLPLNHFPWTTSQEPLHRDHLIWFTWTTYKPTSLQLLQLSKFTLTTSPRLLHFNYFTYTLTMLFKHFYSKYFFWITLLPLLPFNFTLQKRLFTDTVPVNKMDFTDTVPVNKMHLTDTVPVNKMHLTGTLCLVNDSICGLFRLSVHLSVCSS